MTVIMIYHRKHEGYIECRPGGPLVFRIPTSRVQPRIFIQFFSRRPVFRIPSQHLLDKAEELSLLIPFEVLFQVF